MLNSLPVNTSIWKLGKELLSLKAWTGAHIDRLRLKAAFLLNPNFEKVPRMHFQFYAVCKCQICLAGTEFLESNYCHPIWLNISIYIPEICKTKKCWYRLLRVFLFKAWYCWSVIVTVVAMLPICHLSQNVSFQCKEVQNFIQNKLFWGRKLNLEMRCLNSFNCLEGSENVENVFQSRYSQKYFGSGL